MVVEIIKDATLTVKPGQTVDISDAEVSTALRLGLVAIPKKTAPKKATAKEKK